MKIAESIETLRAHLREHEGTNVERRIRFLLALKENPEHTMIDAARRLDIPKRTAQNWIRVYRQEGLDALLRLQARAPRSVEPADEPKREPAYESMRRDDEQRLTRFLNRLPLAIDTISWAKEFRQALIEYLEDVDHVVVNVRLTLDLLRPDTNRLDYVYHQDHNVQTARTRARVTRPSDKAGWKAIYAEGRKNGFPLDLYQEPIGYDYFYQTDQSRLGSIILLRRREFPPISNRIQAQMEELRPFFVYVLSDHVARQRLQNPSDMIFRELFSRIDSDANLSVRERQVLALLVLGYTHAEIAEQLYISVKTVNTHVTHIYAKLGVQRLRDIYARYITPRLPQAP